MSTRKFEFNRLKKIVRSSLDWRRLLWEHSGNFCQITSLHGFKYILGNSGFRLIHSIIWSFLVTSSTVFCICLMFLVWNRFSVNPTLTAVESINHPVWKVPFPAVTICDTNVVNAKKISKVTRILESYNISQIHISQFLRSLSDLIHPDLGNDIYEDGFTILEKHGYTIESLMLEVRLNCDELLDTCFWLSQQVNCSDIFTTIKTDGGYCCSFNYFHTNETFDGAFSRNKIIESDIRYVAGAGIHTALTVLMNIEERDYIASSKRTPSIMIHVHDRVDFPEMTLLGSIIEKGEIAYISVIPNVMETNQDVKNLKFDTRKCYFDDEARLSIGEYGYENCIIECRMDTIVKICGCIPFYYNIKYYKYNSTKVCLFEDIDCLRSNYRLFNTLQLPDSETSFGLDCDCFPTCDQNWYTYSADIGNMHLIELNTSLTSINVYYSEFSCIKYKQSILMAWDGLFAAFGGIFGLCLGGSILSIIEFMYHFTFKLFLKYQDQLVSDSISPVKVKRPARKWASVVPVVKGRPQIGGFPESKRY